MVGPPRAAGRRRRSDQGLGRVLSLWASYLWHMSHTGKLRNVVGQSAHSRFASNILSMNCLR
jgi:hypothetical protein